jgi:hypothetical protein
VAGKIMLYLGEDEQGKFSFAKMLTGRIVVEGPECRRYHHALQLPGGSNWSLREVRAALSTMIDGATHRGGRWFWSVTNVRRISARKFAFVAKERKDV